MLLLLFICAATFLASFGLGMIPLYLRLSKRTIRHMSDLGIGVLVSSALAIIIPEGSQAVYTAVNIESANGKKSVANVSSDHHPYVGLAIVSGFALMFVIDFASTNIITTKAVRTRSYIAVDSLSDLHSMPSSSITDERVDVQDKRSNAMSYTIGLCIHSFADGVALGSSTQAAPALGLTVFAALLFHKGPAAFSLVSILLEKSLARHKIQLHLMAFSLAAPVGALITCALSSWLRIGSNPTNSSSITGLLLLFSGGTFLYVAVSHSSSQSADISSFISTLLGLLLPVIFSILPDHAH